MTPPALQDLDAGEVLAKPMEIGCMACGAALAGALAGYLAMLAWLVTACLTNGSLTSISGPDPVLGFMVLVQATAWYAILLPVLGAPGFLLFALWTTLAPRSVPRGVLALLTGALLAWAVQAGWRMLQSAEELASLGSSMQIAPIVGGVTFWVWSLLRDALARSPDTLARRTPPG